MFGLFKRGRFFVQNTLQKLPLSSGLWQLDLICQPHFNDLVVFYRLLHGSFLPGQCFTYSSCSGSGEGPRRIHLPLANWCLRSAGFINEVCRGFRYHTACSVVFFACNAQLNIYISYSPCPFSIHAASCLTSLRGQL
jgi:hypothetical protein